MQRTLTAAILLVALYSDVGLCGRSSSTNKRKKKPFTNSDSKLPAPTTATVLEHLCHSGPMIEDVDLDPQDAKFYKDNWKDFPSGLYFPNCFSSPQPNMTQESHVNECVRFTMTSSKLNLPEGRNSSDQKARVMWLVINRLCAEESCRHPCSSNGGLGYWGELLIISLVSCSVLAEG